MQLSPSLVERHVVAFIDNHFETYLAAQEADEGAEHPDRAELFPLARPTTIVQYNSEQRFSETELPAIVVETPLPARGRPGMTRGTWDAELALQIGVLWSASDGPTYARDNAGTYLAALRWMFTTQQTVDGLAQGVEYVSDGLTEPFSVAQSRFMAAGELFVVLLIRGIADRLTRPGAAAPEAAEGVDVTTTLNTNP